MSGVTKLTFEDSNGTVEIHTDDKKMFLHIPNTPSSSIQIDPRHIKYSKQLHRLTIVPTGLSDGLTLYFNVNNDTKQKELSDFFDQLHSQAQGLVAQTGPKKADTKFCLALRIE